MSNLKVIATQSTMSNLVGMWAIVWGEDGKMKATVFIKGKADEKYFIVQAVAPLTGEPNVAKLITIEQMIDWTFLPDLETANWVIGDYLDKEVNRFKFEI